MFGCVECYLFVLDVCIWRDRNARTFVGTEVSLLKLRCSEITLQLDESHGRFYIFFLDFLDLCFFL